MGKYDKSCALCGTEVMKKGEIKKEFSTETFGSKKIFVCKDCRGKAKTTFNE